MAVIIRRALVPVLLAGLFLTGSAKGQEPVFVAPPERLPDAALEERPPAYVLPPPDAPVYATLPFPDPLLDRPGSPLPGWFFDAESNFLGVHFRDQLRIPVTGSSGNIDLVQFNGPKLDDTVSPRFEVGYRLEDGWGKLFLGYRFLVTQGSQAANVNDAPTRTSGQLALNSFDFGYGSHEYSLGPLWDMRWQTGLRFTFFYYQSRNTFDQPIPDPSGTGLNLLDQRKINYFYGLGPWLSLELARKTPIPGLSLFARLEGALQFGMITQTGYEEFADPAGGANIAAQNKYSWQVTSLQAVEEVGLCYTLPGWNHSRFLLGYRFETFFQIGRFDYTVNTQFVFSRGQIDTQGLFFRAEFNF